MAERDHVAVKLDEETIERIEALRVRLETEWRDTTRSDVLRLLILKGLGHYETKYKAELEKWLASRKKRRPAPPRRRRKKAAPAED